MLLNDIGKSPDTTLRKINQHLESNFGFKITEDVSDRDLVAIMEQIEEEITELKIKGDDAKASPEISKRLLVLEGMKTLREFAVLQFQSPDLERVVCGLCDFVCDNFRISGMHHGDFEDCIKDAMKHYRSSRYRFPDSMIEQRVRQGAMKKFQDASLDGVDVGPEPNVVTPSIFEEDKENTFEDNIMKGKMREQGNNYQTDDKRGIVPSDKQQAAAQKFDTGELSLEPHEPTFRNSSGRAVRPPTNNPSDPYNRRGRNFEESKSPEVRKNIMKEKVNLVKNLRRLLETEVSEAEVMMAAKGFATELQEMIEKIGRLQNEDLPPVTGQMRETYGTESSSAFQTQIYGALQGVMDALYTAKGQVDDAVSNMASTGQVGAQTDMDVPVDGMEEPGLDASLGEPGEMGDIDAEAGADADLDNIEGDLEAGDEFGGAEEEEPLGRAMKEAALQRKVMEMKKLVEKARKLREARR